MLFDTRLRCVFWVWAGGVGDWQDCPFITSQFIVQGSPLFWVGPGGRTSTNRSCFCHHHPSIFVSSFLLPHISPSSHPVSHLSRIVEGEGGKERKERWVEEKGGLSLEEVEERNRRQMGERERKSLSKMVKVQVMGENNILRVSGRQEAEMSWKEANTGGGRKRKEKRDQWKGVNGKNTWVEEKNVKTWEGMCDDGEKGRERKLSWRNGQEGIKEVSSSVKQWLTIFLFQMELRHCPISLYPSLSSWGPARSGGEVGHNVSLLQNYEFPQVQRSPQFFFPLSDTLFLHSSIPTLFCPPFGQVITWYRQGCPMEEGKIKHWCLFTWSLSLQVMRWEVCMISFNSSLLLNQLPLILLLSRIREHLLSIYTCSTLYQGLLHTVSYLILTKTLRGRHY